MDKDALTKEKIVIPILDKAIDPRLAVRLRILWYLWKKESIDSKVFKDTEDILFGMQTMLRQNLYSRKMVEQLEEHTLYYLFPEAGRVKYSNLHQRRYLLLQRLLSFIGDYAGITFIAKYGHIEYSTGITSLEQQELTALEDAVLNLCDFLANINVNDINNVDFRALVSQHKSIQKQ